MDSRDGEGGWLAGFENAAEDGGEAFGDPLALEWGWEKP
jgi:hypothetical protein